MAYLDDVYAVVQIQPTGVETFVRLSQNENGRQLYFAIQGGELPSGSTATISGTKPDGVVYSASAAVSGNVVTVNEDIQMTAAAGAWSAKLRILNGGQVIATGRIRFVIDADPVAPGSVPSDSELEGLVAEAAAYAEAAKNSAYYGSPLVAATVAGMTDHTRVYVYTGSESGYTNGNWYYWNGSAWTSGGVYNAQGISTDPTLTIAGKAADAKATGDRLTAAEGDLANVKSDLTDMQEEIDNFEGISEEVKQALLACFANVAWKGDDGQDYYDALEDALYTDVSTTEYVVQNKSATSADNRTYGVRSINFTRGDYIEWSFTGVLEDSLASGVSYAVVRVGDNLNNNGLYTYASGHKFIVYVNQNVGIVEVTFMVDTEPIANVREQYTVSNTPAHTNDMVIRLDKDGLVINGTRFSTNKTVYQTLVNWMNSQSHLFIGLQATASTILYNYVKVVRQGEPVPQSDVPEGYIQYDYIKVANPDTLYSQSVIKRNNQILLPISGNKNAYRYEFSVFASSVPSSGSQGVFGGREASGNSDALAFYMVDQWTAVDFMHHGGEAKSSTLSVLALNKVSYIKFNPSVNPTKADVDGSEVTSAWTSSTQTMEAALALFGNPSYDNDQAIYQNIGFNTQIGRFKVYNASNELICDLIPCSNPSMKYGMYDTVSETFLTSTSANTYSCGYWQ